MKAKSLEKIILFLARQNKINDPNLKPSPLGIKWSAPNLSKEVIIQNSCIISDGKNRRQTDE